MPRLSKIYTKTGDDGTTGLAHNERVPKDAARIEAIGDIDELNSWIGVLLAALDPVYRPVACQRLTRVQHWLFNLGGELAMPEHKAVQGAHVIEIEQWIDELNLALPPLRDFVLPGGHPAAAQCFLARAVCRRAERSLVRLYREDTIASTLLEFVNRLSDFLFVLARRLNLAVGYQEVIWSKEP